MIRDIIVFLLIMLGLLVGGSLMFAGDFRHPVTWLISGIGAALWFGLERLVRNSKPRNPNSGI